jgi:hypothetical protein
MAPHHQHMCAYEMPSLLCGSPARGSWRASSGGRGASGGPVTQAHRTSPCPQRDAARGRRPMCCSALTAASPDAPAPLGIFERLLQEGGGARGGLVGRAAGAAQRRWVRATQGCSTGYFGSWKLTPILPVERSLLPDLTQSPKEPISIL